MRDSLAHTKARVAQGLPPPQFEVVAAAAAEVFCLAKALTAKTFFIFFIFICSFLFNRQQLFLELVDNGTLGRMLLRKTK